jgi:hypothetical protein
MIRRRGRGHWPTVILALIAVLLFIGGSALTYGIAQAPATAAGKDSSLAAVAPIGPVHATGEPGQLVTVGPPPGEVCTIRFRDGGYPIYVFSGWACNLLDGGNTPGTPGTGGATVAAQNIATTLDNYLNITNAAVANDNATFQELLSYYEDRAEAIVPYFLNGTWNTSVYDQIAIDSGLAPSIEGIETAIADQEYQDWNATATSWNLAFGGSSVYSADTEAVEALYGGATAITSAVNGYDLSVSQPFEFWASGQNAIYINLEPGGTIINANVFNTTDTSTFTVYDLTQGFSFSVPSVSYSNWATDSVPTESTAEGINQFDLLKLVCTSSCPGDVEISGGYVFENDTHYALTGAPSVSLGYFGAGYPTIQLISSSGSHLYPPIVVPRNSEEVCLTDSPLPLGSGTCTTSIDPTGGNSSGTGAPGQSLGGPATMTQFGYTAQSLINNTMVMAYDYWLTLRAITADGKDAIPATCVIPPPSDAFPTATDFLNFGLDANDIEGVYLSYLNGVAREYNATFTHSSYFCGDPDLGFTFNWTSAWNLELNISASIYLADAAGPLNLAGQPDHNVTYGTVSTWPVYHIDPALLYPYEYTAEVPIDSIYPLPINNPFIGVLVDYSGNLYYNSSSAALTPAWGIPTYLTLNGDGNYAEISGTSSGITSGTPVADGDAIYINSCVWHGVTENVSCPLSATYFDNFSFGLVHAILPPPPSGGGGAGSSGVNGGFCNSLFGWIPFIGGDITDLCNFVLGILEIVLIVGVFLLAIWIVIRHRSGGGGGRTTINVH